MSITERVAYLKGLMAGLDFQPETKEGKIIEMMAEILEDMAEEMDGLKGFVEAIDESLTCLEDDFYAEDEEDDCCCCCGDDDEDEEYYEVTCPHCENNICFDEIPEDKVYICPVCSKEIPLEEEDE